MSNYSKTMFNVRANNFVERDRLQVAVAGSLRGFAASAPPHAIR